jgi:hypothetical protein
MIIRYFIFLTITNLVAYQPNLVIFSYDRPLQLRSLLYSLKTHAVNLSNISVIARTSNNRFKKNYALIEQEFNKFIPIKILYQSNPPHDFKSLVLKAIFNDTSPYVVLAVDDLILRDRVDFNYCCDLMQKHNIYTCLLRLGENILPANGFNHPKFEEIEGDILKWKFNSNDSISWRYMHNFELSIYKKTLIKQDLENISSKLFTSPRFEGAWMKHVKYDSYGMCFKRSKIVNLPLNLVRTESHTFCMNISTQCLQELFEHGYIIDIEFFQKLNNETAHIKYKPVFKFEPYNQLKSSV